MGCCEVNATPCTNQVLTARARMALRYGCATSSPNLSRSPFPSALAFCASHCALQGKAVHIFSAHAPTEAAESATKDAFWSLLDQQLACVSGATSLVCIDANGTVGSIVCNSIGPTAPCEESENGSLLRSVLSSHGLAAVNTFVDGAPTWTNTFGHSRRIDYIAIPATFVPSVNECFVDHNINLSPMIRADHELLRVSIPFSLFTGAHMDEILKSVSRTHRSSHPSPPRWVLGGPCERLSVSVAAS